MNDPICQPKVTHKIIFNTIYKNIEIIEDFFSEGNYDILGVVSEEISSSTIDAQPNDTWRLEIYFASEPNLETIKSDLSEFSKFSKIEIISEIIVEIIEEKDWVTEYQKQLKPIEIGKFFISSILVKDKPPSDKIPIYIEASRAFGTGYHETTKGCIEAMESLTNLNIKNIFDIGTGSGILSFVAEKIWPKAEIIACDIEEQAIEVANINKLSNISKIFLYQNQEIDLMIPKKYNKSFDLIISNILAKPLIDLAPIIKRSIHKETKIILSGFLDYQISEIVQAYQKQKIELEETKINNKWATLLLKA